jgi:hypothetical protein
METKTDSTPKPLEDVVGVERAAIARRVAYLIEQDMEEAHGASHGRREKRYDPDTEDDLYWAEYYSQDDWREVR